VKIVSKRLLPILCLSIVVLFAQSAVSSAPVKQDVSQEKWEYYASDENAADYYYNTEKIERLKNNHVTALVQAIYSEKNPNLKSGRFLWEIDCSNRRLRGLEAYATKRDGTTVTIKESSNWSAIPAESTAETLQEKVCGKKNK
jgi:hypothetical protein